MSHSFHRTYNWKHHWWHSGPGDIQFFGSVTHIVHRQSQKLVPDRSVDYIKHGLHLCDSIAYKMHYSNFSVVKATSGAIAGQEPPCNKRGGGGKEDAG